MNGLGAELELTGFDGTGSHHAGEVRGVQGVWRISGRRRPDDHLLGMRQILCKIEDYPANGQQPGTGGSNALE
jgi:hypothetical protein